jgi:two-component system, OmpR family, response regulator
LQHSQRVLIVDESAECREVLRTALERAGAETVEAATAAEGLRAFESYAPDLIVLDLAEDGPQSPSDSAALREAAGLRATPIVILGTARRPAADGSIHWVAKPYHFAPLVRRIERLLSARLRR